jgi:hypothetical protein
MKLTKSSVVLVATAVAALVWSNAPADSSWQVAEFDYVAGPVHVSCLGEEMSWYTWGVIRFREFETQSRNSHYIEHWTWDSIWIGEDTGRVWFAEGQSPGSFHSAKGEVGQWTGHERARPAEGDGPMFRYNQRFKYTVDANGELRVFLEPPEDIDDLIKCLGPKG